MLLAVVLAVVELTRLGGILAKLVDLLVVVVVMRLLMVLSLDLETIIQEVEIHSHHQLMGGEVIPPLTQLDQVVVEQDNEAEKATQVMLVALDCPHLMVIPVFHQVMEYLDLLLVDGLLVAADLVLMVLVMDLMLEVLAVAAVVV